MILDPEDAVSIVSIARYVTKPIKHSANALATTLNLTGMKHLSGNAIAQSLA